MENKKLGKGLDAIFGDNLSQILEEIQQSDASDHHEIKILDIRTNPYQPRRNFADDKLEELAQSIREHGVFTPILVRKSISGYELIAGERRLKACKKLNMETIPAIVLELSDEQMMEVSLLENIQREDLNAIEEANAYSALMKNLNYTQEKLAERLGKSRAHVANMIRLTRLPAEVQQLVIDDKLTMGHVRPLITLDDDEKIIAAAKQIVKAQLSVREVEKLVQQPAPKAVTAVKKPDIFLDNVRSIMENKLQTKVEVARHKVVIHYESDDDLNRILELIDCLETAE